jgi:predicted RNase H-like HicB family nuclease
MEEYQIVVRWSEEDGCYLAEVPDLPGCIADGLTEAEARQHAHESIGRWIKMAEYMGRAVPKPHATDPSELAAA